MSIFDYEGKVEAELSPEQRAFKSGANDNVVARSLRGGLYGAGSQLASAGAGIADAFSDGAGAGLHAESQSLRGMAALPGNSPRVGSYEQLSKDFSMGNLAEYAGGLVGGSLPISAAGIAGGVLTGGAGFIPAMLGAGAATLPFNMGEVVQKQQADPEAMQLGAGQRALNALGGGVVSSGVESLVPGLVGRQLLGKGLGNLGRESVKQIVGRNAMDIPLEGLTEGTGTAIKQYAANQDKDLDWNEIKEGAIGGAVAGSVFTGVGTAADLAGSVAPAAGDALSSAGSALKTRFEGARGAVGDAADAVAASPAGKKVGSLSDDLMNMAAKGKTKAEDLVGKMMRGEELGVDPAEWARATTDEAKARLTAMADSKGVEVATKWAKEMMDDVGLDAGKRQEVADALANVAEKGGQVAMAGLRQTWEAGKKAAGLVSRFADSFNAQRTKRARADVDVDASFVDDRETYPDGSWQSVNAIENRMHDEARGKSPAEDVGEPPKYSMDDSGAREVVMSALESSGLSQKRPELFNNAESINTMASGLLSMVTSMTSGQLSSEQVSNAISVFGDATSSVMTSMRSALLADATPAETESFFKNLNEIDTIQKRSNGLFDTMRRAFTDEAKTTEAPGRIEEDARLLIAHARGQFDAKSGAKPTSEQAYMNTVVNDFYTSNFGDKADLVRAAVEAEAAPAKADRVGAATAKEYDEDGQVIKADDTAGENSRDPLTPKFDNQGNRLEEAETSAMKFGLSKPDTRGNSKSALNGAAMLEGSRYAKQHMLDLKAAYPDQDVRFEKLPDSEYGHIVVEQRGDPSEFNAQDLADMALDTKKYPKSPSRINIGGHAIDAVKVAKFARNKMQDKWEGDTPTSKKQRLIDGFKQGIAQLEIQFGKIDADGNVTDVTNVSDAAVIGFVGNQALTWGEAKKVRSDTAADRMSPGGKAKLAALRAEYKTASMKDRAAILKEVQDLADFERDRELTAGGDTQERSMPRATPIGPGLEGRPGSAVRTKSQGVDTQWSGDSRRAASARKQYDQRRDGKGVTAFEENDSRFDSEGMLTKEGARMMLEGDFNGGINPVEMAARREGRADSEGAAPATGENRVRSYERGNQSQVRREVGLDENIHLVTNVNGDGANGAGPGRTANMDGSGQYLQSQSVGGLNTLTMVINDSWSQVKTAGAKAVTQRAKTLINNANLLSAADLRKLQSLAPDPVKGVRDVPAASVADAREVINELARKYQDVIVAPTGKSEVGVGRAGEGGNKKKVIGRTSMEAQREGRQGELEDAFQNDTFVPRPGYERTPTAGRAGAPHYVQNQRGNAGLYPEVDISAKAAEVPKAEAPKPAPKAPEAAKPKNLMAENIAKRNDYLDNPPESYSTEKTSGIVDWATSQLERVNAEVAKLDKLVDDPSYDEDRHDAVQTLQSDLRALARRAKAQVQNDKDMADVDKKSGSDLFGGNPDPKLVAAKKAAFLSKVASGDTALLAELGSSTDAKGLQRAAVLLADRAGDLVRTSATELSPEAESALEHANEVINRVNELARQGNLDWRGDKDGAMKGFLKMLTAVVRGDDRARLNMNTLLGNVDQNSSLASPTLNAAVSAKVKGSVKAPLGWYMDAIIADKDTPAVTRAVAEAVAKVARRVPVVGLPTDQMRGAYGLYHQDNGRLNVLNDTDMNLAAVILHEGVHAATTNALTNDLDLHAAVHALLEHVVKHDDVVAASYGATNSLEFLAEGMSNEGFQARLKKIPASSAVRKYLGENVANAWEGFVALVRRALNLRPQDQNALMQLLDLGGRAMQSGAGHTADTDVLLQSPVISVGSMRKLIGDLFNHGVSPEVDESLQQLTQVVVGNGGGNRIDKMVLEMAKVWTKNNPGVTLEADYLELITDSVRQGMAYPQLTASQAINARLSELVQDEDVAYGLQTKKYSHESTDPTKNNAAGKQPGKDIRSYIEKVLGKSVKLAWANFTHAGEFQRMKSGDIIRLSVHALNPMSTAFHESLHAFIAQLKDAGAHDIVDVLYKAARAPHVLKQLNEIYKNQPAVLQQLKDPEERAAYMYQVWAANPQALTIGPATRNVFQKLTDFIRSVLGIWSNDERALHIMRYFNDGSYAKSMGTPNATRRALMDPGRNKAIEVAKTFTQPLGKLANALLSTGDARLRDTNIPALNRLADLIKRSGTDTGGDQGYIPASRIAATKQLSAMAETLSKYSPEVLTAALNVAQTKGVAGTPEVAAAVQDIRAILRDTKNYMHRAGVKLGDLGPEYFPRVWDTHYISQNEQAFRNMLEPYVRSGEFKGNPSDFIRNLTSRMGNEFGIETSTPGMQFTKKRDLDFLKAADVAQFLEKDLMGTLGSYITQATRRAEWERRLGQWDEDTKETRLMTLMRLAKEQGATNDDLAVAGEYLKGVDGTLGDTINPHARRIMGNMIVYQNVRLLPMAMFSMLIDPMGVLVRGGTIPEAFKTFKRGMASIPETYGRKTQADEATRLAELVGVVDAAVLNSVMGDVYTQGMVGGTARKINNAFFKYNMVEGLNRSFRVGASEAAMSFIARHADMKGRHSRRWLAELGLQPGDIKMLSSGTGVALAGNTTKNRIALTRAEGLTKAQETRIHAAINQWVDGAMLRPDAADKPIWMNDPHYALISHLKQFVFSFQKTILGRMMHELRHGNYTPAMALASYVPMMIAADTAKGLIQGGGDTPEWKQGWGVEEYVGYGIQRAGLLGVGQFGVDVVEDVGRGGSGFGALSGPTLEQFADAVQLLGGKKQFGPMLLDAMPANALYKESLGGDSDGGPIQEE